MYVIKYGSLHMYIWSINRETVNEKLQKLTDVMAAKGLDKEGNGPGHHTC
jgi:hypothetical protein